ncbi:schwannomin-interacting protein 1-like [Ctenocephalides felis]|uniref:schwannomin-interacting protein 1-like n=1 Tax=Ctenocephalides felis TaxID=7515 RepID=UPI000E6E152D|nr:schwannomin-interacting protein 1-like [Ctenocephalides felis]
MGSLANMSKAIKRHYKKDSRFVMDLYTLTYDNHESLDSLTEVKMFEKLISQIKITASALGDVLSSRNNIDFSIRDQYSKINNLLSDSNSSYDFPPRSHIRGASNIYLDLCVPKTDEDKFLTHVPKKLDNKYDCEDGDFFDRRRTDREEIRRRLAMGPEPENFSKAPRKKSLQSRLQSGMNLQICFMNDVSDNEGLTSEINVQENEKPALMSETIGLSENTIVPPNHFKSIDEPNTDANERSGLLTIQMPKTEEDFFACQARLQVEARLALAQAKQMAHMQMELERQKQVSSPITDVIRSALTTVGCASPEHHRRLSRRLLTSMTIAQLQVVVCRLHTQVEIFNEQLVGLLMNRDELHMSQDSMLVDIEDLTRYLGAKDSTVKKSETKTRKQNQKKPNLDKNNHLQRISHMIRK